MNTNDKFSVLGSPYWMAPEIIELNGARFASDIWSLGCTVLELINGKPPYYDLDQMTALFRIVSDDCPPIPDGISMHCKDFLYQCFQKQPELRTSAKQLLKHRWIMSFKKNPTPFQIDPKQNLIQAIQVSGRSRNESAPPNIDPLSKNKKNQEPPTPAKKEPPLPAPPAPTAPKQVMIHTPKTKPGKSPEPIRKKTPSTNNKGKPAEEDPKRNDSDEESLVNSDKDTPPKKITIGKSNKKLIKQPNKQKVNNAPKREKKKNKPENPPFRHRFPGGFRYGKILFMN